MSEWETNCLKKKGIELKGNTRVRKLLARKIKTRADYIKLNSPISTCRQSLKNISYCRKIKIMDMSSRPMWLPSSINYIVNSCRRLCKAFFCSLCSSSFPGCSEWKGIKRRKERDTGRRSTGQPEVLSHFLYHRVWSELNPIPVCSTPHLLIIQFPIFLNWKTFF